MSEKIFLSRKNSIAWLLLIRGFPEATGIRLKTLPLAFFHIIMLQNLTYSLFFNSLMYQAFRSANVLSKSTKRRNFKVEF